MDATVVQKSALESVLLRDRLVVSSGLAVVILLAWAYLLSGAGMSAFEMTAMSMSDSTDDMHRTGGAQPMASHGNVAGAMQMAHAAMMEPAVWTPWYAVIMFLMWWIMMVAMMLPSASPMILLFAQVQLKAKEDGLPFVSIGVFSAGYLTVWAAFSLVATGLQWGLEHEGLLSSMMKSTSALLAGSILMAAGIYQFTPLKRACLKHCRSPLEFVILHWRSGVAGAFRMGLEHGAFCVGCCWFLMALLFVGGVMNLYWIIGLALLVLFEKFVPARFWVDAITGVVLLIWGGWLASATML